MRLIAAVLAFLVIYEPLAAQQDVDEKSGWAEDLSVLKTELESRHPSPYAFVDKELWEMAFEELQSKLPEMTRPRFGVEIQRLVGLLGDAHTSANPLSDPALSSHRYPLELYLFEDGLHVISAAPAYADIVGGKVETIGKATSGQAISAVAATISYENTWWIRAQAPKRLSIPEVLQGLQMVDNPDVLHLTVEKDGQIISAEVKAVQIEEFEGHGHGLAIDRSDWVNMSTAEEPPLWMKHPGDLMWYEWLEDSKTLYVCYRSITSPRAGPSNIDFWNQVFKNVDQKSPERFVIDIRENGGGNGHLNRHLVQQILRRSDLDRSDRFFVIVGRETFSAAQQLANELDWWTQATFVGEPTGQRVSQYGDAKSVVLPNSGITVRISTIYHQGPDPMDRRDFIPPEIYAPMTAENYRTGVDPAMEAILSSDEVEPLMSKIVGALGAAQYEEAERMLANANLDPRNRYLNFESDMNAIGYELLGSGNLDAAIAVFLINSRVYPASPNVFDSLGEALLIAGHRAEAIEAYQKALEIDPTFRASAEALKRLRGGEE